MAKKNKDDEFDKNDDINDGRSDDLNNADDNFGLPDVEYTPVNRDEPVTDSEGIEPRQETTSESTYKAAAAGAAAGAAASHTGNTYRKNEEYTRYKPHDSGSNAGKIFAILLVLLLVALGIWYFGIYRPQQAKMIADQEQRERQENEEAARIQRESDERERQRIEQERLEAERLAAEAEAEENKVGTTETISSRTGRYYVVVASALDEDLAIDYAKKMNVDGKDIKIIKPFGKSKFHRVAVADFGSWDEAQAQADNLKGQYGDEVWVVKY